MIPMTPPWRRVVRHPPIPSRTTCSSTWFSTAGEAPDRDRRSVVLSVTVPALLRFGFAELLGRILSGS
jgi:hypothetical protein